MARRKAARQARNAGAAPAAKKKAARPIRVLVCDDHKIVRQGLEAILGWHADIKVIGEAGDGIEAVEKTVALKPDVVLMDIEMPGLDGIEATRRIMAQNPKIRVLTLTLHAEEGYVGTLKAAGAAGYVLKDAATLELADAIRWAHREPGFLESASLQRARQRQKQETGGQAVTLSPREREVITLVVEGLTNKEIAQRLGISVKTVQTHRANLMTKLGLTDRTQLVRYAVRVGLVTP
ncbi:MAG: response regulator transcription factor [Armatimonadetes bacterium]|nr:response regulator transcription factor [Armatimonadota bacterium]